MFLSLAHIFIWIMLDECTTLSIEHLEHWIDDKCESGELIRSSFIIIYVV